MLGASTIRSNSNLDAEIQTKARFRGPHLLDITFVA